MSLFFRAILILALAFFVVVDISQIVAHTADGFTWFGLAMCTLALYLHTKFFVEDL